MFRLNGHDLCSRQIISTYIHVGNNVMPWQFLGIHAFLRHPVFQGISASMHVDELSDVFCIGLSIG